jgi:hypothetical protein
MARAVTRVLAMLAAALLPQWSAAMGPSDPFTPPSRAVPATDASAMPEAAAAAANGLAGVRLGSAPAALIDGEWIVPGQTVRGARLAAIRIDGALLRHPDGRTERLALFPSPPSTPPGKSGGVSIRVSHKRGLP